MPRKKASKKTKRKVKKKSRKKKAKKEKKAKKVKKKKKQKKTVRKIKKGVIEEEFPLVESFEEEEIESEIPIETFEEFEEI